MEETFIFRSKIPKSGKKSYQYSKISPEKSVEYLINEKGTLWIYTRAIHDFDNSKLYPFILEYNDLVDKKLHGSKYIFYSQISQKSKIMSSEEFVGKLRTFSFPIEEHSTLNKILITNLSKNDELLIRGEFISSK